MSEQKELGFWATFLGYPIVFALFAPLVALATLYEAWVLNTIANWYVPHLGITLFQWFGISILVSMLVFRNPQRMKKEYIENQKWEAVPVALFMPLLFLLVAWLGTLFL